MSLSEESITLIIYHTPFTSLKRRQKNRYLVPVGGFSVQTRAQYCTCTWYCTSTGTIDGILLSTRGCRCRVQVEVPGYPGIGTCTTITMIMIWSTWYVTGITAIQFAHQVERRFDSLLEKGQLEKNAKKENCFVSNANPHSEPTSLTSQVHVIGKSPLQVTMRFLPLSLLVLLARDGQTEVIEAEEGVATDYGVDCSFPIHRSTDWKCNHLGDRKTFYENYMQGCRGYVGPEKSKLCDVNEQDRLQINLLQPTAMVVSATERCDLRILFRSCSYDLS
jgi:hypothetical protein